MRRSEKFAARRYSGGKVGWRPLRAAGAAIAVSTTLALATAGLAGASTTATAVSTPTSSTPNSTLESVSCPTNSFCMAVGYSYASSASFPSPIGETWDGTTWTSSTPVVPSGTSQTGALLFSVSCASASFCMAVGNAGSDPLAEEWNGTSWSLTTVANPSSTNPNTSTSFAGVSCPSASFCAAVGSVSNYSQTSPTETTLAEMWSGSSWAVAATPDTSQPENSLGGVSCSSASLCMAVGSGADYSASPMTSSVLAAEWNGTSWTQVSAPGPSSNDNFEGISCPTGSSGSFCMAVGSTSSGTGTLVEVWDGSSWSVAASSPSAPAGASGLNLMGLTCLAANSCFVVGQSFSAGSPTSPGMLSTYIGQWDGTSWTQVASPNGTASDNQLLGVSCASATQCFAVGSSGSCSTTPSGGSLTVSIAPAVVSPSAPSFFTPVSPARVCDTRPASVSGLTDQCTGKTLGPAGTLEVQVTGLGKVPSGATGTVLNVTVTGPTANGYLTIWPAGAAQPLASNLNFSAGETIPNLVQVQLGSTGAVDVYNSAGSTNVIVDVEGYFTPTSSSTSGDTYTPVSPVRIADTRCDTSSPPTYCAGEKLPAANTSLTTFGPGTEQGVTVAGVDGIPASGVAAVVLNVTATGTTAGSYLTVWPAGQPKPTASNLNWTAGTTIPNRVVVPVGSSNQVDIANFAGSVNVIVDIGGYYASATTGDQYVATSPVRLLDTRQSGQALGPGQSLELQVEGTDGIPSSGVTGAVFNVTVTGATAGSFLTVYPAGASEPAVSDLNWAPGATIPNLVVVALSSSGAVTITNAAGSVNVIVDVEGWYQAASTSAAARPQAATASASTAPTTSYTTASDVTPSPHC